ncbi:hypothetical protein ACFQZZ_00375 [Nocardia sp. GCM10030253]|uniref:hypothetical protein n=1 Tax=Nocardia sp. GCM10030253 TaxID=3273404 RepID=UPI0036442FF3
MLHEAAHGVARACGVQDTSRGGAYHNAKYRGIAREFGLIVARQTSRAIYPNKNYESKHLVDPPIQPSQGTVVWLPDSPGSQTGTLTGELDTGIDHGRSTGSYIEAFINGKTRGRHCSQRRKQHWWEIPNVHADDRIEFTQTVTFV